MISATVISSKRLRPVASVREAGNSITAFPTATAGWYTFAVWCPVDNSTSVDLNRGTSMGKFGFYIDVLLQFVIDAYKAWD
jgi:hypothetical protein